MTNGIFVRLQKNDMFDLDYSNHIRQQLVEHRVTFDSGLTAHEIDQIEEREKIQIPPDLKVFLECGVPRSVWYDIWQHGEGLNTSFPDWRGNSHVIADNNAQLLHGILFDVENGHWIPEWGDRPPRLEDGLALAKELFEKAPVMIPIFSHRFIPSEPPIAGNPVFSIVQMDIIHYGTDLADYLSHEFGVIKPEWSAVEARIIPYWQDIWRFNNTLNPDFD